MRRFALVSLRKQVVTASLMPDFPYFFVTTDYVRYYTNLPQKALELHKEIIAELPKHTCYELEAASKKLATAYKLAKSPDVSDEMFSNAIAHFPKNVREALLKLNRISPEQLRGIHEQPEIFEDLKNVSHSAKITTYRENVVRTKRSESAFHSSSLCHVNQLVREHGITSEEIESIYKESQKMLQSVSSHYVRLLMKKHGLGFEEVKATYRSSPEMFDAITSYNSYVLIDYHGIQLEKIKDIYRESPQMLIMVSSYGSNVIMKKHGVKFDEIIALYRKSPETLECMASEAVRSLPTDKFQEILKKNLSPHYPAKRSGEERFRGR